jgi:hypothetical protein
MKNLKWFAFSILTALLLSACSRKESQSIATATVDLAHPGYSIPSGYIGLSHEWGQAQLLMGDPSIGVNPIYRQLLKNLLAFGGGPIILRIGGSTTDRTGEPQLNTITPFVRLYHDFALPTPNVLFILGVNMGANDVTLATKQAKAFVEIMPGGSIKSIEMGNQPDFFIFNKYRPKSYNFQNYIEEFQTFAKGIRSAVPICPLFMAPSMGGFAGIPPIPLVPKSDFGTPADFENLLKQEASNIGIVSQHAYTGGSKASGDNPYPGFLLQPSSSTGDPESAVPYIAVAHTWKKPYRIAEMNSIMISGEPDVSDAFEAALWTADILFEYAYRGVDGVNLHTNIWNTINGWEIFGAFQFDVPKSQYQASHTEAKPPSDYKFTNNYKLRKVLPVYYGLLFFAETMANRSRLMPVKLNTSANLKVWAALNPVTGNVCVAVINKDQKISNIIELTVTGYTTGSLSRLLAHSFSAKDGITWGSQTFDGSQDGKLVGTKQIEVVDSKDGIFKFIVTPTSALLLTLTK